MKQLYDSYFQCIEWDAAERLMVNTWKRESESMSEEKYLSEIHQLYMQQRKLAPVRVLYDTRDMEFQMQPEVQAFVANLFKNVHGQFLAIVTLYRTGIDTGVHNAVQELGEITPTRFQIRYFSERNLALKWLLECQSDN